MKLSQIQPLLEGDGKYLYHVTLTKHVPNIKKKGLLQFQPSNWVKGPGGKRYNEEAGIFAFEHPTDALRWALKWEWDLKSKKMESDMSIVRINMDQDWQEDPSEDTMLRFGKGRSLRNQRNVGPEKVVDSIRVEELGMPMQLGISQQEWFDRVTARLSQ